jgi:hypothetical protein
MIALSAVIKQFALRFYAFFENRITKIAAPLQFYLKGHCHESLVQVFPRRDTSEDRA